MEKWMDDIRGDDKKSRVDVVSMMLVRQSGGCGRWDDVDGAVPGGRSASV